MGKGLSVRILIVHVSTTQYNPFYSTELDLQMAHNEPAHLDLHCLLFCF